MTEEYIKKNDRKDILLETKFTHKTLEERSKNYKDKIGPYEEFQWGKPVGREIW